MLLVKILKCQFRIGKKALSGWLYVWKQLKGLMNWQSTRTNQSCPSIFGRERATESEFRLKVIAGIFRPQHVDQIYFLSSCMSKNLLSTCSRRIEIEAQPENEPMSLCCHKSMWDTSHRHDTQTIRFCVLPLSMDHQTITPILKKKLKLPEWGPLSPLRLIKGPKHKNVTHGPLSHASYIFIRAVNRLKKLTN